MEPTYYTVDEVKQDCWAVVPRTSIQLARGRDAKHGMFPDSMKLAM